VLRTLGNALVVIAVVLGTFLLLAIIAGSFAYYTVCPTGRDRVGIPIAEYRFGPVPFFWQQPEGCLANNAVRIVLGDLGVMDDVTPIVPRLPDR
jgi:hypothetical protein